MKTNPQGYTEKEIFQALRAQYTSINFAAESAARICEEGLLLEPHEERFVLLN